MSDESICARCDCECAIDWPDEPTKYCHGCAHIRVEELEPEVERLRAELVSRGLDIDAMKAENAGMRSKLKRQAALTEEGWDDVPVVDIHELRQENAELRKSVATMSCNHKGIGLPDCRICDPRAKPGAGT